VSQLIELMKKQNGLLNEACAIPAEGALRAVGKSNIHLASCVILGKVELAGVQAASDLVG
jgi:hypothetical protein